MTNLDKIRAYYAWFDDRDGSMRRRVRVSSPEPSTSWPTSSCRGARVLDLGEIVIHLAILQ
jgi:hypothetical protein